MYCDHSGKKQGYDPAPEYRRRATDLPDSTGRTPAGRRGGLLGFIEELRRRQVCRTITGYSVALWLVCQVVELVYVELGLPDWTLKFVIVIGLLGLPIAIILSWLIDITPDGLVVDANSAGFGACKAAVESRRPLDRVIDCALVLAACAIGVQLAVGLLVNEVDAAAAEVRKMTIVQSCNNASAYDDAVSERLSVELQHELNRRSGVIVVAAKDVYLTEGSVSLSSCLAIVEGIIRVTAALTNIDDGRIVWSHVIQQPASDGLLDPARLAREIVDSLPKSVGVRSAEEADVEGETAPGP